MMKKLVIIGAGGYGTMVKDVASQLGIYEKIVFLDDNKTGEDVVGKCGEYEKFIDENTDIYPAFGNNEKRLSLVDNLIALGASVPTIIHKGAYVSPTAVIEKGTVILPMAAVNTGCVIKRACIINTGAIIDHGSVVGEGTHICINAIIKAENRIPSLVKIQAGTVVEDRAYPL
jgi:UDP-N-acetylbacillosamine N-acetyltransferase